MTGTSDGMLSTLYVCVYLTTLLIAGITKLNAVVSLLTQLHSCRHYKAVLPVDKFYSHTKVTTESHYRRVTFQSRGPHIFFCVPVAMSTLAITVKARNGHGKTYLNTAKEYFTSPSAYPQRTVSVP